MITLLIAYAIAGAAVSAYAAWLAIGNRRTARRLERLEALIGQQPDNVTTSKRVA